MGGRVLIQSQLAVIPDLPSVCGGNADKQVQLPVLQSDGPCGILGNDLKGQLVILSRPLGVKVVRILYQSKGSAGSPSLKLVWACSHGLVLDLFTLSQKLFHVGLAKDGAAGVVQRRNQGVGRLIHVDHKMGVVLHLNRIDHGHQMAHLWGLLLAFQGELYILRGQGGTVVELHPFFQSKLYGHIIYVLPAVCQISHKLIVLRKTYQVAVNVSRSIGRCRIIVIVRVQRSQVCVDPDVDLLASSRGSPCRRGTASSITRI